MCLTPEAYAEQYEGSVFRELHNDQLKHMMMDDLRHVEHPIAQVRH